MPTFEHCRFYLFILIEARMVRLDWDLVRTIELS